MTKRSSLKTQERNAAIERLRGWLKPGDTVCTILRHVSASGMQREIGIVIPTPDGGRFLHPNHAVATALGLRLGKRDGVIVNGCGMDMGFHVTYNLARVLWPAGFGCVGERCPSNDHSNGDRDRTPHYDGTPRNAEEVGKDLIPYSHYHKDGGYALRSEWL